MCNSNSDKCEVDVFTCPEHASLIYQLQYADQCIDPTFHTRYYTQTRLAEDAFSDLLTAEDKELTQLGTIKMILMEQVCIFA
jgi:hypothetical protein